MNPRQPIILSLTTITIGLIGILGWTLDLSQLQSVIPGYPTIKFNTSLAILLSGIALYRNQTNKKKNVTSLISYSILILGAATLSQSLFNINLGIDQLLFIDTQTIEQGGANPGRMSPLTAFSIVLIGLSLILYLKNALTVIYKVVVKTYLFISFFSILSYLYNIPLIDRFSLLASMSIPTSIAVFLLGIGLSYLRPKDGITGLLMSEKLGGKLARKILPKYLFIVVFTFYLRILLDDLKIIEGENGMLLFLITIFITAIFIVWDASEQLNITDSKRLQAESRLKTLNDQLKLQIQDKELLINTIFQSSNVIIISTDKNGVVTNFNKGAEIKLGYLEAEVKGKFGPELWHAKDQMETEMNKAAKKLNKHLTFRDLFQYPILESKNCQCKFIKKDGSSLSVQLITNPMFGLGGEFLGGVGVAVDLTDTLAKIELEILSQQLKERNQHLLEFSSIVTHNLRSPIKNLDFLLNMFEESHNEDEREAYFSTIRKITTSMNNSLDKLIDSLKEKETQTTQLSDIYFEQILIKTKEILSGDILESNASITYDFKNIPKIKSQEHLLESIFLNIISNSIKYRSIDRNLTIHVESKGENGYIKLTFIDNGLGIDLEKNADKIFGLGETFHQKKGAKGMGLYMTKQQIENLGGKISLESKEGKGTKISILLKEAL